jgi:hypothetical protein
MSTVTIPRPDVTTEDVAAALRMGLGPRYQVKPGMRTSLLPGAPDPGWPGRPVGAPAGEHDRDRPQGSPRAADRVRRLAGRGQSGGRPGPGSYP